MNWALKIWIGLRGVVRKRQLDAEMEEEMRSHIEMRTQQHIEVGMTPEEARYAALKNPQTRRAVKLPPSRI